MKTPYAILIGLSLIAAAIFFKDTVVKPAHAIGKPNQIVGFSCTNTVNRTNGKTYEFCYMVDHDHKVYIWYEGKWIPRPIKW